MDKKGSALISGIIIALIGIVVLIAFLSPKFRFFVIGIGFLIAGVVMAVQGNINKTKGVFIILFILIGALFITFNGVLQEQFPTGTYIQAPTFYYYECNAGSQPVESIHVNLITGSSGGWITIPSNTDTADLWISQTETTKWYSNDRRIVYQICHNGGVNCDPQVYTLAQGFALSRRNVPSVHISNLLTTDRVWVDYQRAKLLGGWELQPNGAEWYHTYKPFILWKVDMFGGGRTEYSSIEQGCKFTSAETPTLINSVSNLDKQLNTQTSTGTGPVPFYKTRNFIGPYTPISTENINFVTYGSQQGYCLNRQVFAISTVNTNGATYRIVDSNFNTRLAPSVACCPGEDEPTRTCNSNFQWVNKEQAECSAFNPCAGADWMDFGSKTQKRYNCISGKCVVETKTVECTLNSDCLNNQECDTSLHKCVDVLPGPVVTCGNKICEGNLGETQITCPLDCTISCADKTPKIFGYQEVTTTTQTIWSRLGLAEPKTTNWCKPVNAPYIFGGIIIVLVVGAMVFIIPKKKVKGKSTKYGKLGKK